MYRCKINQPPHTENAFSRGRLDPERKDKDKTMAYNESYFENKLRLGVKRIGGYCLKFVSPGFMGVPDRIILLPGARVLFAEMKAPGKSERKRQSYVHKILRRLGFTVFESVDSDERIEEVLTECRRLLT